MSSFSLFLILIAACVHIVPHIIIKGAGDRTAFVWWMLLWNAVIYAPVLFVSGRLEGHGVALLVGSGLAEAIYLFAISRAYATGELSIVYPLARGSAPLLLLVSSIGLLRERLTAVGVGGIVAIAAGIYLINLPRLGAWRAPLQNLRTAAPRWALLAGLMTATYTTIDKIGVRYIAPLPYIYLAMVATFIAWTPAVLMTSGVAAIGATFRANPWRTIVAGITMPLAYALVLTAMHRGVPAGYAGSVREISVVLATFAGAIIFRERINTPRILGASAIVVGIVLIAAMG